MNPTDNKLLGAIGALAQLHEWIEMDLPYTHDEEQKQDLLRMLQNADFAIEDLKSLLSVNTPPDEQVPTT